MCQIVPTGILDILMSDVDPRIREDIRTALRDLSNYYMQSIIKGETEIEGDEEDLAKLKVSLRKCIY